MSTPAEKPGSNAYLSPHYWPTWLGVGLLRLAIHLPYRAQLGLGRWLGEFLYGVLRERRRIAAINLALCFPDKEECERRRILRRSFQNLGISLFETAFAWWGARARVEPLTRIEGLEHLEQALSKRKGAILLSAHMTCLEMGGRALSLHQPFQAMVKETRNKLFSEVMLRARRMHTLRVIPRHDTRPLIRGLRDNIPTWYAPDQDFGPRQSVFAPFLGVPAATLVAPARLARATGAPVVPFLPRRLPDAQGYCVTLLPALEGFPSGDDGQDAARINAVIGAHVARYPEQYLWQHRRFKTRPPDEPSVY